MLRCTDVCVYTHMLWADKSKLKEIDKCFLIDKCKLKLHYNILYKWMFKKGSWKKLNLFALLTKNYEHNDTLL